MLEGHDYTIYSNGPSGRARLYALIAIITAFLTPLTQHWLLVLLRRVFGDDWNLAETALFFGGFTTVVLYGLLINLFDAYLWKTPVGRLMFAAAGLQAPPHLAGTYSGTMAVFLPGEVKDTQRGQCKMKIAQTWEQIGILIEFIRPDQEHSFRASSDMATLQVGLLAGEVSLRFAYTFEETLVNQRGFGEMSRQITGTAICRFTRSPSGWTLSGHFYDDGNRSGHVQMEQDRPAGGPVPSAAPSPPSETPAKPKG
jgi:hypothetical protein